MVLVNFWNTWCGPCIEELPDLTNISVRFQDEVMVLGLVDEDAEIVREFVAKHGVTFPTLLDDQSQVRNQVGLIGVPWTLVFDANGKMTARMIGTRTHAQLLEMLASAGVDVHPKE